MKKKYIYIFLNIFLILSLYARIDFEFIELSDDHSHIDLKVNFSSPYYTLVDEFGEKGREEGQFYYPSGISFDGYNRLYVCDPVNSKILVFEDGEFSFEIGDLLSSPVDIQSVPGTDRYIVSDSETHSFIMMFRDGRALSEYGGVLGSEGFNFARLAGLYMDSEYNIFLTDRVNDLSKKIDRFMNITDKYGKSGNMKGELNDPRDICTDDSGNIYITNYGNDRVDIFDSDFIYRGFIGSRGKEPGNFRGPVGITVDSMQNIYVCDFYNGRVQKFTTDGNLVGLIGTGELKHPNFVTVDNSGKVYVSDVGSADVKVYSPEMFTEGKKALLDKDYEKAEKLLEYAVNIDSSNYNAYYYLGYTYYKLRKYGELLGITASLSEKDVDNRAYELLEVLCREVKKWRLGY